MATKFAKYLEDPEQSSWRESPAGRSSWIRKRGICRGNSGSRRFSGRSGRKSKKIRLRKPRDERFLEHRPNRPIVLERVPLLDAGRDFCALAPPVRRGGREARIEGRDGRVRSRLRGDAPICYPGGRGVMVNVRGRGGQSMRRKKQQEIPRLVGTGVWVERGGGLTYVYLDTEEARRLARIMLPETQRAVAPDGREVWVYRTAA